MYRPLIGRCHTITTPAVAHPGLYTGPLTNAARPWMAPAGGSGTLGAELLNAEQLTARLRRFGHHQGIRDIRAQATQWSKWHFAAVVVPFVATSLLLDRELPVALAELRIAEGPDARTERTLLPHAGRPLPAGCTPTRRFRTLLAEHLVPLCDALAGVSRASPRVFASNAGNVFEYMVHALEDHPMARPDRLQPAFALMRLRRLEGGGRNPLHAPVRYRPTGAGRPVRVRRVCCIRYLEPALGYCGNCPLLEPDGPADC